MHLCRTFGLNKAKHPIPEAMRFVNESSYGTRGKQMHTQGATWLNHQNVHGGLRLPAVKAA